MTLRWRRCAVALGGALLLGGCTSGGSSAPDSSSVTTPRSSTSSVVSTSPPTPADPTAPCAAGALRATLVGGGPAMGHVGLVIRFVNRGPATCRERGWPRLVARTAGVQVTAKHTRSDPALIGGAVRGLPAAELRPGRSAFLVVSGSDVTDAESGNVTGCSTSFRTFRITLPGDSHVLAVKPALEPTLSLFHGFPTCGGIEVTPVVPSTAVIDKFRDVAGRPALPRCPAGRLHARYRAGSFRDGHDFGYLRLINDSSTSCQLSGTITVHALDRHGRLVRLAGTPIETVRLRAVQFLAHDSARRTAAVVVGAGVRTADGREACPIKQRVVPASWRLSGAVTATVANTDTTVRPNERGRVRHLYGCAGSSGIVLLDATLSTR